ncbi:MAG: DNA polymerase III subunit beta [Candidatus Vogelbacteria bacterium]
MKLECAREKLRDAVGLAEKITGKNLSLPILNSVLFDAGGRNLVIRATNLELGIEIVLPCRVFKTGAVAVPGAVLFNFLSNITVSLITLEVVAGNLVVSSPQHTTIINGYPPGDFPSLPRVVENKQSFSLPADHLSSALRAVSYGASTSLVKPEIASVCLYNHNGELAVVATDSFRLAEKVFPPAVKINMAAVNLIIPVKNVAEIIRVLEAGANEVVVEYSQHQISFQIGEIYLASRLVDGVYPDYRQIIPTTQTTEVIVLKNDFLGALKLLNIFVDRFGQVTIAVSPADKKLEFTASNDRGENTSRLTAAIEGGPITLAMNIKYLLDCFQSITTDSIRLKFNGPNKPVVVQGVGEASFTYLIMPINR